MKRIILLSVILLTVSWTPALTQQQSPLRFEVTISKGLVTAPQSGRLFICLGKRQSPEPRLAVGDTSMDAAPLFARDVKDFAPGITGVIDDTVVAFPVESLSKLPAGEYFVQAMFDSNIDLKSINSPGNLYSAPKKMTLDPATSGTIRLELTAKIPDESLPQDTEYVNYVKIQSDLLTKFHKRPIYLRAGVILPRDFAREPTRRYPLRVHIGGYGSRFTGATTMISRPEFRSAWMADDSPRMLVLYLDGDGPYGDCYQVNSENNGPYGDAITQELIPYVEKQFRAIGEPYARVVDGGSTGGWVSLALQIFYPDFFNGVWSYCPDGVDFRQFQLVNIYSDDNAYINRYGFERPSARDLNGDVRTTIRHECRLENVLGAGDSWTMSGEQWGAWNATYGPRGVDGRPKPVWNPQTGEIDRTVIEHWKKYDLRFVLEQNWKTLGPKLRGKIRIWIGEADDYFLNNAVHLLDQFLSKADPSYDGKITYAAGKGHCWLGLTERQLNAEMAAAMTKPQR